MDGLIEDSELRVEDTMSWMDVIKPLQKALYKAPEQFDEVRGLIGDAITAAKETAKHEIDSIQMGVDLGEALTNGTALECLNRVIDTKGPLCDAGPGQHGPMCECVRAAIHRLIRK
jgi:hypothetical protein